MCPDCDLVTDMTKLREPCSLALRIGGGSETTGEFPEKREQAREEPGNPGPAGAAKETECLSWKGGGVASESYTYFQIKVYDGGARVKCTSLLCQRTDVRNWSIPQILLCCRPEKSHLGESRNLPFHVVNTSGMPGPSDLNR